MINLESYNSYEEMHDIVQYSNELDHAIINNDFKHESILCYYLWCCCWGKFC